MIEEDISIVGQPIHIYRTKKTVNECGIIFIHGSSLSGTFFKKQLNSELADLAQLIAFDLPGCGNTPLVNGKNSMKYHRELLISLIAYLGLKKCLLVGHSYGGHVAIEALPDTEKTDGLFVFGTPPISGIGDIEKVFNAEFMEKFYGKVINNNDLENITSLICLNEENKVLIKELIKSASGEARVLLSNSIPTDVKNEIAILNSNTKYPVFIGHSIHDPLIKTEYIKGLNLKNLWKNHIHYFELDSHSPNLDYTDIFNHALTEYAKDIFL